MKSPTFLFIGLIFLFGCMNSPTCSDGLLNQGEEGVDCGGPCLSCTTTTTLPPLPDCGKLEGAARDMCYYSNAEKSLDVGDCEKILEGFLKADCMIGVANQRRDEHVCSQIELPLSRDECYKNIASKTNEKRLCGFINNTAHKDSCYYNIAMTLGNKSLCGYIEGDSTRLRCLAIRDKDPKVCLNLTSKARDWCLYKVVDVAPENEVCDLINSSDTAEQCYIVLAKSKADESICRRHTKKHRQECIAGVIEAKKRLEELNKQLNSSEWRIQPKY
ncbi:MAG: hypothetical protein GF334_07300 [Candidatus Altiarchaeales archaeon]|nr:hypothetical protein [Candidatus Altiarchaeales archaeon]